MRWVVIALAIAGCGGFDVDDIGDDTKPSAEKRCDHEIQAGDRLFTIDEYNAELARCLHGTAAPGDGGTRD